MALANVKKAMRKHEQRKAARKSALNEARSGTEGSKLNDTISSAFCGPKRRNS
jgi:hypothetical protein